MINSTIVLYNSGWLICDICRFCVQTLAQELRRTFLNITAITANEITVWIPRSNSHLILLMYVL